LEQRVDEELSLLLHLAVEDRGNYLPEKFLSVFNIEPRVLKKSRHIGDLSV